MAAGAAGGAVSRAYAREAKAFLAGRTLAKLDAVGLMIDAADRILLAG